MARVFYVHWNKDEALETVRELRDAGHGVDLHWNTGEEAWRLLKEGPPDALVISLDRLPSHGRTVANVTTESKRLRGLPVIFVGGEPDKVAATRAKFSGATFCSRTELLKLLKRIRPFVAPDAGVLQARTSPAVAATRTKSSRDNSRSEPLAGYSGTPLPQKLGIKAGSRVAFLNEPADFRRALGELPADVNIVAQLGGGRAFDLIVLFAISRAALEKGFRAAARRLEPAGSLWASWPKKSSGVATDLSENVVREVGLAAGLVDVKVCAVDQTWSGLKFMIRVKDRGAAKLTNNADKKMADKKMRRSVSATV